MARRVFYSFHYMPDNWRASKVRMMGVIEGNRPCSDNDWEKITQGSDPKIKKWIAGQMVGKSCVVVLIGSNTAGRKWINYEIEEGWKNRKGVVGIHIHNLEDRNQKKSRKGENPFDGIWDDNSGKQLSSILKAYDPQYSTSKDVYNRIKAKLEDWVEEAITIRNSLFLKSLFES